MITRFGSKEIQRALKRWGKDIEKDVKRIVNETATIIQSNAVALAPVDSGYLRQSINVEVLDGGMTAVVTVDADYAIYIEYGTGIYAVGGNGRKTPWVFYSEKYGQYFTTNGMRAQPFWFPSVEQGRKYFIKEMKKLGK